MNPQRLFIIASLIIITTGVVLAARKDSAWSYAVTHNPIVDYFIPNNTEDQGQSASVFIIEDAANRLALTPSNIIWHTNRYRVENGLPPLIARAKLNNSARDKNIDMFAHQYFSHERPSGFTGVTGFDVFVDAEKYGYLKTGENLAMGYFRTSKEVVDAWINSPKHRSSILDADYTDIGVSVDFGFMNGKLVIIATQHFGKPMENVSAQLYTSWKW